jgi:senataxin
MHPDISQLPSRLFYDERLQDGPDMATKTKQLWHSHKLFGTYRFFNVSRGQEEEANGHSLKNKAECQVAVALYHRLRQEFSGIDFDFRVGIVSMYNAQIHELRRVFEHRFGRDIVGKVDFNTVDGFQGQEKDVIILSCVRAGPGLQTVGFLSGNN